MINYLFTIGNAFTILLFLITLFIYIYLYSKASIFISFKKLKNITYILLFIFTIFFSLINSKIFYLLFLYGGTLIILRSNILLVFNNTFFSIKSIIKFNTIEKVNIIKHDCTFSIEIISKKDTIYVYYIDTSVNLNRLEKLLLKYNITYQVLVSI